MPPNSSLVKSFIGLGLLFAPTVTADGNGLIGWGKTMYDPPCAFACRGVIAKCTLLCTPAAGGANHGSHHNPVATPPECFTTDNAFLRTMALCIDTYCPTHEEVPPLSQIDDYWYSHLGTGSVGNYKYVPTISYIEALLAAREDEKNVGTHTNQTSQESTGHEGHNMLRARHEGGALTGNGTKALFSESGLPIIRSKQPLNVTSFIDHDDWQKQFNGMRNFEMNENVHSYRSITILMVALFLPIVLSLLRFIPGLTRNRAWVYLNCILNYPAAFGSKHRTPTAKYIGGGLMPTRGQALYIATLSVINIIFLVGPYPSIMPQSIFGSKEEQDLSTIGNRAGVLAMGNVIAMFAFSARNNVLLYITDWSYGTFLLLHRWLGYWTIFHTALHSVMLLEYYIKLDMYAGEFAREYWIWGIVGTVAVCAILPSSLLVVRQKAYEIFLITHIVFVALFIIGYYYHIWYLYQYKWGYEIWAFLAIGLWVTDRIWRLVRMASHGVRTARVSEVEGSNGEYVRIDIDGVLVEGVVYLCFPTLSWKFWETHPFSVASSFAAAYPASENIVVAQDDSEKLAIEPVSKPIDSTSTSSIQSASVSRRATFVTRTRTSVTALLANKLGSNKEIFLPILIEGSYHTGAPAQLADCTNILCIAGGVGITAVLPYLRAFNSPRRGRLFWGMRNASLKQALATEISELPSSIYVETSIGKRLDVSSILQDELAGHGGDGLLGIVVCGPAGLADDVRQKVTELTRHGSAKTPFVFVDEAFGW